MAGSFTLKGGALKVWRCGGVEPKKQARGTTPTRKGIWAWPYPVWDTYYVAHNERFGKARTVFWLDGPFYSRLTPHRDLIGFGGQGDWWRWEDPHAWVKIANRLRTWVRENDGSVGTYHAPGILEPKGWEDADVEARRARWELILKGEAGNVEYRKTHSDIAGALEIFIPKGTKIRG